VVLLRLLAAAAVVGVLAFMYLDAYIQREFSGKKWAVPAMVYGRPLELYAGAPVGPRALGAELETLGYRAAGGAGSAGTYSVSGSTVSIATRGFRFWDGEEPARRLRVAFAGNSVQTVRDEQGTEVALARLEPCTSAGSIRHTTRTASWCGCRMCRRC
jgi:penicillin-binding protein 1B